MLITPRQRPVTAITRGKYIIPNRPKLGPKIFASEGEAHTVTLTGPGDKASVSFNLDAGKKYRVFCAVISSTGTVYTPVSGEGEQFEVTPGTFTNDANTDLTPMKVTDDPTTYGFELVGKRGSTIHMENAAEADPGYSITYGHFYAREIKS